MSKRVVMVTWLDAHQSMMDPIGEESLDEFHTPCFTQSVGFVLREDARGISIAGCFDEDEDGDRCLFVPKGMIEQVRVLK
jgi:hypothetical protein